MRPLPAICDRCGALFPSDFGVGGSGRVKMVGNRSGPCPVCGGMGTVPDGIYSFAENAAAILVELAPDDLASLASTVRDARNASAPPEDAVGRIAAEQPALGDLLRQLVIPREPGAFWGMLAVLLTLVILIQGCHEKHEDPRTQVEPDAAVKILLVEPERNAPAK